MYDTILVPIDGSDPSNRAAEHALELGVRFDAAVHVVNVVDTGRYGEPALSSAELVIDELEDRGHDMVDTFADRVDAAGLEARGRVCHGDPAGEILALADEVDADLIVLGYQGHSHRLSGHLGSVAERVVHGAGRPVLTV
ncbi:universal stress protein [Halegenticoccus tardaugens]|uniref:universal stress protein n=1 Tax=Halegenticoccus tardaugens TaxID=2071624 RepID=UPI00100AF4CD|nr:universal stress protein [Halegenticoccus tardaugens]